MTDATPMTNDDRRSARLWAEKVDPAEVNPGYIGTPRDIYNAARVILATVPAPSANLADELRGTVQDLSQVVELGTFDGLEEAITDIADRVEAVVQDRDKAQQDAVDAWEHAAQTDRDHVRAMGLWEQDYARVAKERDEARNELEQIRKDADHMVETYAAQVERLAGQLHTAECNHAYSAERWNKAEKERDDARSSLERESEARSQWMGFYREAEDEVRDLEAEVDQLTVSLNRQCTTVTPSVHYSDALSAPSDTLPDPADVPKGEPWLVTVSGAQGIGFRHGDTMYAWGVAYEDGIDGEDDSSITLVSRLVPDTRRVIDRSEDLDKLPVGSIVIDEDGDPGKKIGEEHWGRRGAALRSEVLLRGGAEVTLIHEPEVTA